MQTRTIGPVTVSAIGLGGMPMSIEGRPDEGRSIRTIHAALDAGVTLIDTADAYHLNAGETGHNERLIAKALASYSGDTSDVLVATKGGHLRPGDGSWTLDGSPAHLREAAEASLKALGVDVIGLYQFHRPDPKVPYAESIGGLKELLDAGKIRLAGISNASIEQIELARSILGEGNLASVQNEFSPRVPVQRGRTAALRRGRYRVPAVEPARRDRPGRPAGHQARRIRRDRRGARGVAAAGDAGLDAGQGAGGHPDPWCEPPRVHHRLGPGPRADAHPR